MFEPVLYDDYVKAITTNRIFGYTGDCYAFFAFLTRHYSDQYIETVARHILNCGWVWYAPQHILFSLLQRSCER